MNSIKDLEAENKRLRSMIYEYRETISRLSNSVKSHEAKEQSISSAILFAVERSNQWDNSMQKLYELGIQRLRLLYARMERVLNELYNKYPALKKEAKLKDMADKFKSIAYTGGEQYNFDEQSITQVAEDPIKKLLTNIISYIGDEKQTKVLPRKQGVATALSAISSDYATTPSKSGFDINEALNPTENLEDILKSFNLKR